MPANEMPRHTYLGATDRRALPDNMVADFPGTKLEIQKSVFARLKMSEKKQLVSMWDVFERTSSS